MRSVVTSGFTSALLCHRICLGASSASVACASFALLPIAEAAAEGYVSVCVYGHSANDERCRGTCELFNASFHRLLMSVVASVSEGAQLSSCTHAQRSHTYATVTCTRTHTRTCCSKLRLINPSTVKYRGCDMHVWLHSRPQPIHRLQRLHSCVPTARKNATS